MKNTKQKLNKNKSILIILILFAMLINSCKTGFSKSVEGNVLCSLPGKMTAVHQIQGASHLSPLDGQEVYCVEGVVLAIKGDGFYMQDWKEDEDERTSEGIFVSYSNPFNLQKGDQVLIKQGRVKEWNPAGIGANSLTITTILAKDLEIKSQKEKMPAPTVIGEGGRMIPNQIIENDVRGFVGRSQALFDPAEDGMDFFESLESMYVQVNRAVAISTTNKYKEISVVGDGGKYASGLSETGVLVIQEHDYNPERIMIDDQFLMIPAIKQGAKFIEPIVGVIGYDFGNYRLHPVTKLVYEQEKEPTSTSGFKHTTGQISIATYNVENFYGIGEEKALWTLADEIVNQMDSPDILVLQEIQDDDGSVNSIETKADKNIAEIIKAILTMGGPEYKGMNIDPERNMDGGIQGGNIRTILLYHSGRGVEALEKPAGSATMAASLDVVFGNFSGAGLPELNVNPGRIWPQNSGFLSSRKPIAAQFLFEGQSIFVIGNHFNSKGGDGALFGDVQPPNLDSERQRITQAKAVNGFVKDILEIDPGAMIFVMGDLNDFQWSEPLKILKGNELSNLMETFDPFEQYTYIYEGNGQALDHILVSEHAKGIIEEVKILHLNTKEFVSERLSDHDPVIAILKIPVE